MGADTCHSLYRLSRRAVDSRSQVLCAGTKLSDKKTLAAPAYAHVPILSTKKSTNAFI